MLRVLALDISTNTGWALLEGSLGVMPKIVKYGTVVKSLPNVRGYGDYPFSYIKIAREIAGQLYKLYTSDTAPDVVVIEETNKARARYTQKVLEYLHCVLVGMMYDQSLTPEGAAPIIYISSSAWRKACGIGMSKEDKAQNAKLNKAKRSAGASKLDKKALGITGKVTKKHLSVRKANELFALDFKMKDNDVAEAILLGVGFFLNAERCDGIKERY